MVQGDTTKKKREKASKKGKKGRGKKKEMEIKPQSTNNNCPNCRYMES